MSNPPPTSVPTPDDFDDVVLSRAQAVLRAMPDHIGRYRILELLGHGGMGEVYVAEQTTPIKRRVAVKLIKAGMDTRQVVARFEAERQALAMMDHPNIAKVFDAGTTDDGRPYFVMELVRGVPITQFCDDNKLTTRQRVELLVPVCQAVQHAHQKGIIHRDLKPTNVLVTLHDGKPVPKVIDFGIAKATGQSLTDKTIYTEFRQMVGTPAYMSPEQAEMSGLDIDTRSDVYSLGAVAYELLTGSTPFDTKRLIEAGLLEIGRIIKEEDPPTPSRRLSTLGERLTAVAKQHGTDATRMGRLVAGELDWIVMKAMDKDRRRRYDTASDLAADLERHLAGETVIAAPPSWQYRFAKFARRNRATLVTAGVIAAMLVAGTVVSTAMAIRARRAEAVASAQRDEAGRQRELAERQQQETAAVIDFLNKDVFQGATPARMPDKAARDAVVKSMLEPAAKSARSGFKGRPLVQAAVLHQIGANYNTLGRFTEAAAMLKEAADIRRRELGPDADATLSSLERYGQLLMLAGRFTAAETILADVLRRRRGFGDDYPATISVMGTYSDLLSQLGHTPEALAVSEEAVDRSMRVFGADDDRSVPTLYARALVLIRAGRHPEASAMFGRALAISRRVNGDDSPQALDVMSNYVRSLAEDGRLDEALPLAERNLATCRRVFGERHNITNYAAAAYAGMLENRGRLVEAESLYKRVVESADAYDNPMTAVWTSGYVSVLRKLGRGAEADAVHDKQQRLYRPMPNWAAETERPSPTTTPTNAAEAQTLVTAGDRLEFQKRHDEALAAYERALPIYRQTLAPDEAALLLIKMAISERPMGLLTESERHGREALAALEARVPPDPLDIAAARSAVGRALIAQSKDAEAAPFMRAVLATREVKLGKLQIDTQRTANLLMELLVRLGKFTDAADIAANFRLEMPASRPTSQPNSNG